MNVLRRRLGFDDPFVWRGTDMSRMEAFSDAVFAFALTLIVVTLEPPTDYADLTAALAKFPGFAIAFLFLVLIWVNHSLFFRRYGLEDGRTLLLNSLLMFLVLFYVYPMRFLVSLLADVLLLGRRGWSTLAVTEWKGLMTIYGLGFAAVYLILWLMFRHGRKHAEELELTPMEIHMTRELEGAQLVNVAVGVLSAVAVHAAPLPWAIPLSGWMYWLLWPGHHLHVKWRARRAPEMPGGEGAAAG